MNSLGWAAPPVAVPPVAVPADEAGVPAIQTKEPEPQVTPAEGAPPKESQEVKEPGLTEEAQAVQPTVEEPAAEQPQAEQPKAEKPMAEKPAKEASPRKGFIKVRSARVREGPGVDYPLVEGLWERDRVFVMKADKKVRLRTISVRMLSG